MKLVREINVGHILMILSMVGGMFTFVVKMDSRIKANESTLTQVIELQKSCDLRILELEKFRIKVESHYGTE